MTLQTNGLGKKRMEGKVSKDQITVTETEAEQDTGADQAPQNLAISLIVLFITKIHQELGHQRSCVLECCFRNTKCQSKTNSWKILFFLEKVILNKQVRKWASSRIPMTHRRALHINNLTYAEVAQIGKALNVSKQWKGKARKGQQTCVMGDSRRIEVGPWMVVPRSVLHLSGFFPMTSLHALSDHWYVCSTVRMIMRCVSEMFYTFLTGYTFLKFSTEKETSLFWREKKTKNKQTKKTKTKKKRQAIQWYHSTYHEPNFAKDKQIVLQL